jgi:CTP synthase
MQDAYLSVTKSLFYASIHCDRRVEIVWIEASDLEQLTRETNSAAFLDAWTRLKSCQGILVPGGFGDRGIEGMILAVHYAREKKIPFFGICLGFQVAVIEFCRSQLNISTATSGEFDAKSKTPVIIHMDEISKEIMGGTMRLGSHTSLLSTGSISHYIYGKNSIKERHRHRYEVNPKYISEIHANGGRFTGTDDKRIRMEVFELDYTKHPHPFFFGVQFHPEFLSRPLAPSPPFLAFVLASAGLFPSPTTVLPEEPVDVAEGNSIPVNNPNLIHHQRHVAFPPTSLTSFQWNPSSNAVDCRAPIDEPLPSASTSAPSIAPPKLFIP